MDGVGSPNPDIVVSAEPFVPGMLEASCFSARMGLEPTLPRLRTAHNMNLISPTNASFSLQHPIGVSDF